MASIVGSIYGGIAAYFGGVVDDVMMRIVEILLSVPYLLIVILISVVTDSKSLGTMLVALTLTGWCGVALMLFVCCNISIAPYLIVNSLIN